MECQGDRLLVVVTGLPGTGKSTIAAAVARRLGAAVLGHDWAMSGLRPYPELQAALDGMDPPGHRPVGWSILLSLARAQLRRDASVVLDGVARAPEMALARAVADEETARLVVVMTQCSDAGIHRSRVVGRQRGIPARCCCDGCVRGRVGDMMVVCRSRVRSADAGASSPT